MVSSKNNDNPIANAMRAHLSKYAWDNSLNQNSGISKLEPKLVLVGEPNGNDPAR